MSTFTVYSGPPCIRSNDMEKYTTETSLYLNHKEYSHNKVTFAERVALLNFHVRICVFLRISLKCHTKKRDNQSHYQNLFGYTNL